MTSVLLIFIRGNMEEVLGYRPMAQAGVITKKCERILKLLDELSGRDAYFVSKPV